jgi:hypothetical protein
MQLMNLLIRVLPNAGSGNASRFGTSLRLGIKNLLLKLNTEWGGSALRERILSASGKSRLEILGGRNSLTLKQ